MRKCSSLFILTLFVSVLFCSCTGLVLPKNQTQNADSATLSIAFARSADESDSDMMPENIDSLYVSVRSADRTKPVTDAVNVTESSYSVTVAPGTYSVMVLAYDYDGINWKTFRAPYMFGVTGDVEVVAGETATVVMNMVWLDLNGIDGATDEKEWQLDNIPAGKMTGSVFNGWVDGPEGGKKITKLPVTTNMTEGLTLYADTTSILPGKWFFDYGENPNHRINQQLYLNEDRTAEFILIEPDYEEWYQAEWSVIVDEHYGVTLLLNILKTKDAQDEEWQDITGKVCFALREENDDVLGLSLYTAVFNGVTRVFDSPEYWKFLRMKEATAENLAGTWLASGTPEFFETFNADGTFVCKNGRGYPMGRWEFRQGEEGTELHIIIEQFSETMDGTPSPVGDSPDYICKVWTAGDDYLVDIQIGVVVEGVTQTTEIYRVRFREAPLLAHTFHWGGYTFQNVGKKGAGYELPNRNEQYKFNTIPQDLFNQKFLGWYDNPEFTGEPVTFIPGEQNTESREFWAKWTVAVNRVVWNAGDGTGDHYNYQFDVPYKSIAENTKEPKPGDTISLYVSAGLSNDFNFAGVGLCLYDFTSEWRSIAEDWHSVKTCDRHLSEVFEIRIAEDADVPDLDHIGLQLGYSPEALDELCEYTDLRIVVLDDTNTYNIRYHIDGNDFESTACTAVDYVLPTEASYFPSLNETHKIIKWYDNPSFEGTSVASVSASQSTVTRDFYGKLLDEVTIEFWHIDITDDQQAAWRKIASNFEESHPGVKIDIICLENQAFKEKIAMLGAKGSLPDIFRSWGGGVMVEQAEAGLLKDISGKLDTGAVSQIGRGDKGVYAYDGVQYGAPYSMGAVGLWYNKAVFQDAGLTEEDFSTWTRFTASCGKLKEKGYAPVSIGGSEDWTTQYWWTYLAQRLGGEQAFLAAYNGTNGGAFNTGSFVTAMEMFSGFVATEPFQDSYLTDSQSNQEARVADRVAAMSLMGQWAPSTGRDNATKGYNDEWGVMPFPAVEGGAGAFTDVIGGGDGYLVGANAPDEAVEFLKSFFEPENYKIIVTRLNACPVIPGYDDYIDSNLVEVTEIVRNADYFQLYYDQFLPSAVGFEISLATKAVLAGTMTPQEACNCIQTSWEENK